MITIFTTHACPRCVLLKAWLESHKIQFQAKEIDGVALADMMVSDYFGRQAPILFNGQDYHGPDEVFKGDEIDKKKLRELI